MDSSESSREFTSSGQYPELYFKCFPKTFSKNDLKNESQITDITIKWGDNQQVSLNQSNVDIVKKSITSDKLGVKPPANNARTPRPVFDPVPPPRFGVTNSN